MEKLKDIKEKGLQGHIKETHTDRDKRWKKKKYISTYKVIFKKQ